MERVFTQTFGVAGAIIEKDGAILLVQEANDGSNTGKWNQPAGWIDIAENPVDSVIREVKEETGLDFKPTRLLGVYSLVKESMKAELGVAPHGIKLIFCGEIVGGELMQPNEEISALKWFTPEEIMTMDGSSLKDTDIKQEVEDYFSGKGSPIEIVTHTVQA